MTEDPRVLVMSCRGAGQGAMSVVRTLGRRGINVSVLSDSENCLTAYSRYCEEFVYKPDFTTDLSGTLEWLLRFSRNQQSLPVLFPTADPDLALVSTLRTQLEPHFRMFLAPHELLETLMDKIKFMALAEQHKMPVPATFAPKTQSEFLNVSRSLTYPAVLKPSNPVAWTHPEIQRVVHYQKALVVQSVDEMRAYYSSIAPWSTDVLMQEYIVGPDDHHYSAHVYMDRQGEAQACFTGRKVRVHPAFAGSGCYVQSVAIPELLETSLRILRLIGYQGVAVLNFKQDSRTGEFRLHEINPRISQWNILATQCGVDVPFAAYSEAVGLRSDPMKQQSEAVQYVDLRNDLKSWRQYREHGQWGLWSYVASLLRKRTVYQLLSLDDPMPFMRGCVHALRSVLSRLRRGQLASAPGSNIEPRQVIAATDAQPAISGMAVKQTPDVSQVHPETTVEAQG